MKPYFRIFGCFPCVALVFEPERYKKQESSCWKSVLKQLRMSSTLSFLLMNLMIRMWTSADSYPNIFIDIDPEPISPVHLPQHPQLTTNSHLTLTSINSDLSSMQPNSCTNIASLPSELIAHIAEYLQIKSLKLFASTNRFIANSLQNYLRHQLWKKKILSEEFHYLLSNTYLTVDHLSNLPEIMDQDINSQGRYCQQYPDVDLAIGITRQSTEPFIMLRVTPRSNIIQSLKITEHQECIMIITHSKLANDSSPVTIPLFVYQPIETRILNSNAPKTFVHQIDIRISKFNLLRFIEELITTESAILDAELFQNKRHMNLIIKKAPRLIPFYPSGQKLYPCVILIYVIACIIIFALLIHTYIW